MHKTHAEQLTRLIKEAFALTADSINSKGYALKVVDRGSAISGNGLGNEFKFAFFPGLALSRGHRIPAPVQGDALNEVALTIDAMLEEVFSDSQYTYGDDLAVNLMHPFSDDPYIYGSFTIGNIAHYAGRASDLNHKVEFTVRDDKASRREIIDSSFRGHFSPNAQRRLKNPASSVLGALILGGIIGHTMK